MKKQIYQKPNIKVYFPAHPLLQTWENGTGYNSGDIESKKTGFVDDDEGSSWGRTWGQ